VYASYDITVVSTLFYPIP